MIIYLFFIGFNNVFKVWFKFISKKLVLDFVVWGIWFLWVGIGLVVVLKRMLFVKIIM